MGTLKILVSGSVDGKFGSFYERISKVNEKNGPFDMVLVVGPFFGSQAGSNEDWINSERQKSLKIPNIPIYLLGPSSEGQERFYQPIDDKTDETMESGFAISENATYLGKKGFLTSSSGLRIAYLSGKYSSKSSPSSFNDEDIQKIIDQHSSSSSPIDILITSQAPKEFENYLEFVPPEMKQVSENEGSPLISRLALNLKPRYHFAGAECFVERRPYRNHRVLQESNRPVTRLFCVASVDNSKKQKWLYAFNMAPSSSMDRKELTKQPDGTTENPYLMLSEKEEKQSTGIGANQFFYATDYNPHEQRQSSDRKRKRDNQNDQGRYYERRENRNQQASKQASEQAIKCWFCLASPDVEKHLIISIGDFCYLALPKGGLVPEHCLIIPIEHHRSFIECSDKTNVVEEVEKFKKALESYFASKGKFPIFFERNYRSYHFQIQVIPVPDEKAENFTETILRLTEQKGLKLKKIPPEMDLSDLISPGAPYFYMESNKADLKVFTNIRTKNSDGSRVDSEFPLQLGRELLANTDILDMMDRSDWRTCVLDKEGEKELAQNFKKNFKPHDFTL